MAVFYSPRGQCFTVDKTIVESKRARESCFDPRHGAIYELHRTDNYGFQTYTPPSSGRGQDWILVLEGDEVGAARSKIEI